MECLKFLYVRMSIRHSDVGISNIIIVEFLKFEYVTIAKIPMSEFPMAILIYQNFKNFDIIQFLLEIPMHENSTGTSGNSNMPDFQGF